MPSSGSIQQSIHYFDLRVYYENTDAGGIVYHSDYLNFAERARTELLRCCGISQQVLKRVYSCILVVRQLNIKYEKVVHLDDIIQVQTRIKKWSLASFDLDQSLWFNGECVAVLEVMVVCVDFEKGSVKRFPPEMIEKIKEKLND